jgi:Na+-transporting NADH:ubiquinone oxidoreductase subunit NqrF
MQDTYLFEEFKQLNASYPNFTFMNCLSREENLECVTNPDDRQFYCLGHVNDGLETVIKGDLTIYQYYLCGGPNVVESLREYLTNKGIPTENIHFEKFTV